MSEPVERGDPFGLTPDVACYVARRATDAAFDDLCRLVLDEKRPAVLTGPAGMGKTLLLRRLADRAQPAFTPVYLPYAALAPDELCQWILAALDAEATEDPIGLMRAFAKHLKETGSALLLLVDDASVLPPATARWLGHLVSRSDGAVRAALAAGDRSNTSRMIAALGEAAGVIRLSEPMTDAETRAYVEARLARARVPTAQRELFDEATLSRVQRVAAGVPRRVHAAAAAVLRGQDPESIGGFMDGAVELSEGARTLEALVDDASPAAPLPDEPESESESAPEPAPGPTPVGELPPSGFLERPPVRRVAPAPGLRWVLLTALGIAAAAVTVPLLLSQGPQRSLPEPRYEAPPRVVRAPDPAPEPQRPRPPARPSVAAQPAPPLPIAEPDPIPDDILPIEPDLEAVALLEPIEPTPEPPILPKPVSPPVSEIAALPEPERTAPIEPEPRSIDPIEPEPEPAPAAPGPAGPFAVSINATPWASIEIDGISVGETPLAGLPLLGGEHSFKARLPDGRVVERTVLISAEDRYVTFE